MKKGRQDRIAETLTETLTVKELVKELPSSINVLFIKSPGER
jgi:hypothetical protein